MAKAEGERGGKYCSRIIHDAEKCLCFGHKVTPTIFLFERGRGEFCIKKKFRKFGRIEWSVY